MSAGFRSRIRRAIADPALQEALDRNYDRRMLAVEAAFDSLGDPSLVREQARQIRLRSLEQLDELLLQFEAQLGAHGVWVHRAADGSEACRLVIDIARRHGGGTVVKAKSMVTEEIGLNHALEGAGLRAVETDLGEYLAQLRGEAPSHIITPVVHLRREDAAKTFERALGMPYTTDVEAMTRTVRRVLREEFLGAAVGVSGVNFGVAETGTLCLVTNEGNGRMTTTLPAVHIALMGIERLVPTLSDLAVMLRVLPRSATGQKLSSYVTLIHGPRARDDPDGPIERHLILVDNGRRSLRASPLAESLLCIRCGACLNACPVYREIGGHAYGSIYPGPIGSVVSPGLFGLEGFGELAKASTLCGACREVCPVQIDLPKLLLRVRALHARAVPAPFLLHAGMRLVAWTMARPGRYRWAQRLASAATRVLPRRRGWLLWLPPPLNAWTDRRDFPPFAARPFRECWSQENEPACPRRLEQRSATERREAVPIADQDLVGRFERELVAVGGEFIRCPQVQARERILSLLGERGPADVLAWGGLDDLVPGLRRAVTDAGHSLREPALDLGAQRAQLEAWAGAGFGLTGAEAGFAETGSLLLTSGAGRSQLASLLPWTHVVVLPASRIHATLEDWLVRGGAARLCHSQTGVLITGPSRTADIEMTLTIGVHGPGRLVVVCLC